MKAIFALEFAFSDSNSFMTRDDSWPQSSELCGFLPRYTVQLPPVRGDTVREKALAERRQGAVRTAP